MERLIKPVVIGVVGLFVVMLLFSLLLPGEVMTSKWVRVANDKDSVISTVSDLKSWPNWNLLLKDATDVQFSDSALSWTSPNGHSNRIRIEGVEPNGVATLISLNKGDDIRSGFSIEKRDADSVQVVWYIIEDLKWYPWEKFYGMMAADMKGPLMQESLQDLKKLLSEEKK